MYIVSRLVMSTFDDLCNSLNRSLYVSVEYEGSRSAFCQGTTQGSGSGLGKGKGDLRMYSFQFVYKFPYFLSI